ncbi:MAG: GTPase Era [Gracilibacteraceae bacterium]|jgi:GTP-binding protein Era|nr:GTPase Era [Gracilibacteraceae bacterium]
MTSSFHSGFVAVVGRPNAGKSTLLNTLLGQKVVIVSDKPQTTRNRIRCILTEGRGQIIFFDTPGVHKPAHQLGEYMLTAALGTLSQADAALLVVDLAAPFGSGDEYLLGLVRASSLPCVLVLNKTDLAASGDIAARSDFYAARADFRAIVPLSALRREETAALPDLLFPLLPPGPLFYGEDEVTDKPERFLAAEMIREKLMLLMREEIPHSVAVVVDQMEEMETHSRIRAIIFVERASQKAIIIGQKGERLREAGILARRDIEEMLGRRVYLDLWVKVQKGWRNNPTALRAAGYRREELI